MDAQASLSHPDLAPTVHVVPTQTTEGGEPSYVCGGSAATRTERELIKMAAEPVAYSPKPRMTSLSRMRQ